MKFSIESLRDLLRLEEYPPLSEIPDEELLLALNPDTYDAYEYYGDAVFHMIITNHFIGRDLRSAEMTKVRHMVECNLFLRLLIQRSGIDKYVMGVEQLHENSKVFADVFEALLGVFTVFCRKTSSSSDTIDLLGRWCNDMFALDVIIEEFILQVRGEKGPGFTVEQFKTLGRQEKLLIIQYKVKSLQKIRIPEEKILSITGCLHFMYPPDNKLNTMYDKLCQL